MPKMPMAAVLAAFYERRGALHWENRPFLPCIRSAAVEGAEGISSLCHLGMVVLWIRWSQRGPAAFEALS